MAWVQKTSHYHSTQMRRQLLRLQDGRLLSYFAHDSAASQTNGLIYFHGWPSSGQEATILEPAAAKAGISLVSFDRPGIGLSSLDQRLSFQSIANDVAQLIQSLGWRSALMCGTSGGGPFAAACAALLPSKGIPVDGLVLIASMTHTCGPHSSILMQGMDPGNRLGYATINYLPTVTRLGLGAGAVAMRHVVLPVAKDLARPTLSSTQPKGAPDVRNNPQSWLGKLAWTMGTQGMAEADKKALYAHRASAWPTLLRMTDAVFGAPGYATGLWQDMWLTSQPWNFPLSDIKCPTLVFQGTADVNVTVNMARYLSQSIPGASLPSLLPIAQSIWPDLATRQSQQAGSRVQHEQPVENDVPGLVLLPDEGHLSTILNQSGRIFKAAAQLLKQTEKDQSTQQ